MKTKSTIREYFQFTRKDRIALLIIALILLSAFFLPVFLEKQSFTSSPVNDTSWITSLRQLERPKSAWADSSRKRESVKDYDEYVYDRTADGYNNGAGKELFTFNPNTLDPEGWRKLGIREKTIVTIQKYLAKGGQFRKPQDLQKVYGLRSFEYKRLEPYIKMDPPSPSPLQTGLQQERPVKPPHKETKIVDINVADSSSWESLPGIGPTLAMRIIRFRDKLGGFYSVQQVKETFGLADSVFLRIRPLLAVQEPVVKKINLNTATLEELRAHPYLRYAIANAVMAYRNAHGPFKELVDLKKVMVVTGEVYEKILPYLEL